MVLQTLRASIQRWTNVIEVLNYYEAPNNLAQDLLKSCQIKRGIALPSAFDTNNSKPHHKAQIL